MNTMAAARQRRAANPASVRWTGRTLGGYWGHRIMVVILRFFGLWWAYAVLAPVSVYYLLFAPSAVKASQGYFDRLWGRRRSWPQRTWTTYRHFYSFAKILLDRVAVIAGAASRFRFVFDGEEHLLSALDRGQGLVLLSAHCGNWEMAAHMLHRLNVPVSIVAFEGEVARIQNYMDRVMAGRTFSVIPIGSGAEGSLAILAALSRKEVVAMLGDRFMGPYAEEATFLGHPCRFPTGPYIVAGLSGAPIVFAFAMREGSRRYRFIATPHDQVLFHGREEREAQIRRCLEAFVGRLQEILIRYPLQWHNFYDFWGTDGIETKANES